MWLRRSSSAIIKSLLIMFIIPSSSQERCELRYEITSCTITANCTGYVEISYYYTEEFRSNCFAFVDQDSTPIRIIYKDISFNVYEENEMGLVPAFLNYVNENNIISLDISNNAYTLFPILRQMSSLKYLNVSNNLISTAVLSSQYQFPHLEEIDISRNLIEEIHIDENDICFCSIIKLNVSRNNLVTINGFIFRQFNAMEYLDLSYNEIAHVNDLSFQGLNNLLYLNLAHNKISKLSGSLRTLLQLQQLFLNNNELTHLSINEFTYSQNLQQLDCSNNLISIIDKGVFSNTLQLKTINLKSNLIHDLDKLMFVNTTLESIDLSDNDIETIPKSTFKLFNLTYFDIQKNKLRGTISHGTFAGLVYILQLNLSSQNISSLSNNAFFGLDNLRELNLDNNNIEYISPKSFSGLKHLKRLDLTNNLIKNLNFEMSDFASLEILLMSKNKLAEIKKGDLDDVKMLQCLDVSHNNISHVESFSFMVLTELVHFNISNNPLINELESNTFHGLNSLPALDISKTALTEIQNETFNHMYTLRTLNISSSALKEIHFNAFLNTAAIEVLDLSYNFLKYFNVNSTHLANLRDLYLNHNFIAKLSSGTFFNMTKLSVINLSFNEIAEISDYCFSNAHNISLLDLSSNKNIKINVSTMPRLEKLFLSNTSNLTISFSNITKPSLTELYMSANNVTSATSIGVNRITTLNILYLNKNNISSIDSETFSNLVRLHLLDLSYNGIEFIQTGAFSDNRNLNLLNISHNHLVAVRYGDLYGLKNLNTLDLSYNSIEDVQSERFYDIPTLRVLIIDHNKIKKVTFEDIWDHNINILSIGDNDIPCAMIRNLKMKLDGVVVTAMVLNHKTRNVDGITCYDSDPASNGTSFESDKIFFDIKNLLLNITSDRSVNDERIINTVDNRMKDLINGNNRTNILLEKYLYMSYNNVTVQATSLPIKHKDIIDTYNISRTLKEFENSLSMKNEKIISNINHTIVALINKSIIDTKSKPRPSADAVVEKQNSQLFMEICTGLIMVMLLCYMSYKVYKIVVLSSRRPSSLAQQIIVPMNDSRQL